MDKLIEAHELGLQERERGREELLADLRRSNAALTADLHSARSDRDLVERELTKKVERIAELEQRAVRAEEFQRAAEAETTRVGQRALRAESERDQLKARVAELEEREESDIPAMNRMGEEIRELRAERDQAVKRAEAAEARARLHSRAVKELSDARKELEQCRPVLHVYEPGKPTAERVYGTRRLTLEQIIEDSKVYESWGVEIVVEIATHLREVVGERDQARAELSDAMVMLGDARSGIRDADDEDVARLESELAKCREELARLRDGVEALAKSKLNDADRHEHDALDYVGRERGELEDEAEWCGAVAAELRSLLATSPQPASVDGEVVEPAKVARGQVWRSSRDGSEWRIEDIHRCTVGIRRLPEESNLDVGYMEWWADMRGHTLVEESNGLAAGDCGYSEGRERSDDH